MKRFMYILGLIMCLAIMLVIGIYIGGQLAQAQSPVPVTKWCREKMNADNNPINGEEMGKKVPVEWMAYLVTSALVSDERVKYVYISVTQRNDSGTETYLDPNEYWLYIKGINPDTGEMGCLDRVPVWP